jgi:hypothetical protein
MSRYYFDVHASPYQKDEEGKEFATLEDAKLHAREVGQALVAQHKAGELLDAEVVVRDDMGEVFRLKVATY